MNIFIACCKQKTSNPTAAENLYISRDFKRALKLAKEIINKHGGHIYILSAKYHLVELTDIIEPYNLTLQHSRVGTRKEWSEETYKQMIEKGIDFNEDAIFFAGSSYTQHLVKFYPHSVEMYTHFQQGYINKMLTQLITNKITPFPGNPTPLVRQLMDDRIRYIQSLL